ncbi:hypothetical protein [Paenibacillus glucanolyticus]|uniref:hypothetical protein n=1 Tax=Paenibacillus glucanolyticus TaxID=59843 RepID=UPI00096C4360|nr:hypothetical protein [Paenibacillus glucanolyticus]OMF76097.1 hypothetical protein BK142_16550 [Paenibacillus glucanolyticus]
MNGIWGHVDLNEYAGTLTQLSSYAAKEIKGGEGREQRDRIDELEQRLGAIEKNGDRIQGDAKKYEFHILTSYG